MLCCRCAQTTVALPNPSDNDLENWERHVTENNHVFYYNVKTKVSSWPPPPGFRATPKPPSPFDFPQEFAHRQDEVKN